MVADTQIRYAKAPDGVNIAYMVSGTGPIDVVIVPGFISHLEALVEYPPIARALQRFRSICRTITFDKRGTGLSDRPAELPDLDQRMLDLEAVMDATGCQRAALMGISEGAAMAIVFAATHPERVSSLALYGAYAMPIRTEDHPLGVPPEQLAASADFLESRWGTGAGLSAWAPSLANDPEARHWWGRLQRQSASPAAARELLTSYNLIDARPALPLVQAPTLVVHRTGDRMIDVSLGREIADGIPGARFLEFPGEDHLLWAGNADEIIDAIAEFQTGAVPESEPDRVLATVLFADIVRSTEQVSALGDGRWRDVLDAYDQIVEQTVTRHGGRIVKHTGDGSLAVFSGPTRAIKCAQAITGSQSEMPVLVRAGLHSGEVVMRGEDVSGVAVHLAERVSAEAEPGEVLVSRTLVDLTAGSGLQFDDRGNRVLRGFDGTWRLFAVA